MKNDVTLTLAVLRRQLDQRKMVDANIHNLAKTIFKPGAKVQWQIKGRDYYGSVVEVIGDPGTTGVLVEIAGSKRTRKLNLADISGLVQET